MGTRGIWSLENVEIKKPQDDWVDLNSIWLPNTVGHGYYAGGFVGGNVYIPYPMDPPTVPNATVVSKLAYATSSIARQPSADLPDKNCDSGPFSSSTAGFMVGGSNNANGRNSIVRKLTYATDTTTTLPARHSQDIQGLAAMSYNDSKAFTTGGRGGPSQDGSWGNNTMRIYSLPTCTNSSAPHLSNAVSHTAQALSSSSSGYVAGGVADFSPAPTVGFLRSFVQKLTFSNNTNARSPSSDLVVPIKGSSAAGGSTDGYFMGGGTDDMTYPPTTSQIQKFTYSTDTTSLNPSNMLDENQKGSATGNPSSGYSAGGMDENPIYTGAITKIDFSTGTTSNFGSTLPQGNRNGIGAFSALQTPLAPDKIRMVDNAIPSPNFSYTIAQNDYASVYKINYNTGTYAGQVYQMNQPGSGGPVTGTNAGTASNVTAGYVFGGTPSKSMVAKLSYATDSYEVVGYLSGGANTVTHGYQSSTSAYASSSPNWPGGGWRKMPFSTETFTNLPGVEDTGSAGSSISDGNTAGYHVGGTDRTNLHKMNYSNDTHTESIGAVPHAYIYGQSSSAPNAGYLMGGETPSWSVYHSWIQKFTYSTSTWSITGQPGLKAFKNGFGTGNTEFGVYGGNNPSQGAGSEVYRCLYATDTSELYFSDSNINYASGYRAVGARDIGNISNVPPTATPTPSTYLAYSSSISDNGYLGGGWVSGNNGGSPSVYKINMTTETLSTPSGLPNFYRAGSGKAISSTSNAYFAGGPNGTGPAGSLGKSTVRKISYSSDSETSAPNMQKGVHSAFAFGNTTHGFILGGSSSEYTPYEATSFNQKITYSTESWTTSTYPAGGIGQAGSWHIQRSESATGGTSQYGYIGPAAENWAASNVVKYTYSTDVATIVPGYDQDGGWRKAIRQVGLNSPTDWYVVAGMEPAVGEISSVAKMSFATETVTNGALNMNSIEGEYASGLDNPEKGFGLVHRHSLANKLTFSTDTSSNAGYTVPNPSPGNKYQQGGTSQKDFGLNSAPTPYVI